MPQPVEITKETGKDFSVVIVLQSSHDTRTEIDIEHGMLSPWLRSNLS